MKITGQILKERRESMKLSLSEISMQTKVNQKILKAIEEGNTEQLPAKTFLRGFVQAYATALKLDVDQIMKSFFEEMGTTTPEVAEAEDASAQVISGRTLPTSMQSSATVRVLAVTGIVVLILLVFGVKSLVEKYENESRVEPVPETIKSLPAASEATAAAASSDEAAQDTSETDAEQDKAEERVASTAGAEEPAKPAEAAPATAAQAAAPTPAPAAAPEPTVTATPPPAVPGVTPVAAKPPEKAPEVAKPVAAVEPTKPTPAPVAATPSTPPKPPPDAAPVAKPAPTPAPAPTPSPAAATTATATPAPASTPPPAASKEVILEALDRIEVAVKVDKGNIKKIVLQPDEVYTIKGLGKIVLDLSDGGAVNLIVNGQDRGVPGDLGKPKKVELP